MIWQSEKRLQASGGYASAARTQGGQGNRLMAGVLVFESIDL